MATKEKWSSKANRWLNPFRRGVGLDIGNRINASSNLGLLGSLIYNIPLKDGGRVRPKGCGKAKRGFGRAKKRKR